MTNIRIMKASEADWFQERDCIIVRIAPSDTHTWPTPDGHYPIVGWNRYLEICHKSKYEVYAINITAHMAMEFEEWKSCYMR